MLFHLPWQWMAHVQHREATYSDGLTVGANCLQLSIEDGGPNDIDAAVDGTVTHFSGIAIENIEDSVAPEPVPIPTQVQSSSGGGCTVAASGAPADGSLLLLLLLGLLGMVREKIKLGELKAVA